MILKVENLTKEYGKGITLTKALDNVSFSVKEGEFVAIVGASGSGKSTLLHLIGGVDQPTSGKVIVDDIDVYSLNDDKLAKYRCEKVGLIYQFYNLIPILNVEENIKLPVLLNNKKVDEEFLKELINTLKLEEYVISNILSKRNLDSIVNKIESAIRSNNPRFIYRAPFIDVLVSKLYSIVKG